MKILILGIYRTGTTSLQYGIADQGYEAVFEPYNQNRVHRKQYTFPLSEIDKNSNIVVKCITDQIPSNVTDNSVGFYSNFIKSFDRTILLSRQNKKDHFISFLHQYYCGMNKLDSHKRYKLDLEFLYNYFPSDFINKSKEHITAQYKNIEKISSLTAIPITYYEDLYSMDKEKVLNTLLELNLTGIDIYKLSDYLSITKRYRVTNLNVI